MINRDRLVETFCDLARIDSPSGEEEAIATDLTRRLEELGLDVIRDSYGNVIASDGRENPIMLSGHMDTVEPGRGIRPKVDGDRIVSDGTTILGGDCKAGLSAILEALESLKENGVDQLPVEVVFTREEEIALLGAQKLDLTKVSAREAIVFDSEGPVSTITSSSPTYIGFDVEIKGRAAHAGVEPEKGVSAIRAAAELITSLPQGRLDDETTFNVGTIEGGRVRNAVPDVASIRGEFRSMDLETIDSLRLQLHETLDTVRARFPEASIEAAVNTEFETYSLGEDDPARQRVEKALRSLGLNPTLKPSGGGTDGNVYRLNGISAAVVGMAVYDMHTVDELVVIPELVETARLCETLLTA